MEELLKKFIAYIIEKDGPHYVNDLKYGLNDKDMRHGFTKEEIEIILKIRESIV
jgi:hypothetical protein